MLSIMTFNQLALLFLISNPTCFCINSIESLTNSSQLEGFSQGVATWYGEPYGVGTTGGACGFGADVANAPYYGLVSAGNQQLFEHGAGCGNCYLVKCTNPSCSGNAITVTIADECPGSCNSDPIHFDLSGKAFGALAKPGQDNSLRSLGKIDIQYQRVRCHYNAPITFKIDKGSNPNYLAFVIEDVGSDGDIGAVQISSPNSNGWLNLQRSWGATWFANLPNGIRGPYTVKVTTIESKTTFIAYNVIPLNWQPGSSYHG